MPIKSRHSVTELSNLTELRELKISNEYAQEFFSELGELTERYVEKGADVELLAFYIDLAATAIKQEIISELYE